MRLLGILALVIASLCAAQESGDFRPATSNGIWRSSRIHRLGYRLGLKNGRGGGIRTRSPFSNKVFHINKLD